MSSIINADTSNGLKLTSDTSGEVKIQSAGADIVTVNSTGITMAAGKTIPAASLTGTLPALNGSALTGISSGFTSHLLVSGTTFYPKSTSTKMYVGVYGATGGIAGGGGAGGSGFSEKYYNGSLAASYSYSIGAAGSYLGTAGGTTTFDVMTVTGSGGVTSNTPSTGGVGSGGDFNATGGTGGIGSTQEGGYGGDATRAGNGGNGGDGSSVGGGGGGTGGNNGSGNLPGAAATSAHASALDLVTILNLPSYTDIFYAGGPAGSTNGGYGAPGRIRTSVPFIFWYVDRVAQSNNSLRDGQPGYIFIVEW